jgi:hypothetical protein
MRTTRADWQAATLWRCVDWVVERMCFEVNGQLAVVSGDGVVLLTEVGGRDPHVGETGAGSVACG